MRDQGTLFPDHLEDWIDDENAVRVIDAFVEELDLPDLGFELAKATGQPGYHHSILLKLYVDGYLNCVQSSRRLEREMLRNVEVMWLLGRYRACRRCVHQPLPVRKSWIEFIRKTSVSDGSRHL